MRLLLGVGTRRANVIQRIKGVFVFFSSIVTPSLPANLSFEHYRYPNRTVSACIAAYRFRSFSPSSFNMSASPKRWPGTTRKDVYRFSRPGLERALVHSKHFPPFIKMASAGRLGHEKQKISYHQEAYRA